MSNLYPVIHQNYVTKENKYSVYCKKQHKVDKISNLNAKCFECPYLYGLLQGNGVECAWEDTKDVTFYETTTPQVELKRISVLIEKGMLQKG